MQKNNQLSHRARTIMTALEALTILDALRRYKGTKGLINY